MVLCANAGIDRTYEVKNFSVGEFHNPDRARIVPGGKGVNVARDLAVFDDEVMVTGFTGDMARSLITDSLGEESIITDLVSIGEESRECINIVDPESGTQTRLDEIGPLVTPTETQKLQGVWRRRLQRCELAVISGSTPRGVPHHFYHDLVTYAHSAEVPVIVDARDQLLEYVVDAQPAVITPNQVEFQDLIGETLSVPEGIAAAAGELLDDGIKIVVCTLGRRGALFATSSAGIWMASAPAVTALSPVGCGDALVAGLAHASLARMPIKDRMRWAVAAGSAAATALEATLEDPQTVRELLEEVELQRIDTD